MTVSDARRCAPFGAVLRTLGASEAETFMELVVPAGADVATKADLAGLRARFATILLTVSVAQTALAVSLIVALQR
jgi:phage-related protein